MVRRRLDIGRVETNLVKTGELTDLNLHTETGIFQYTIATANNPSSSNSLTIEVYNDGILLTQKVTNIDDSREYFRYSSDNGVSFSNWKEPVDVDWQFITANYTAKDEDKLAIVASSGAVITLPANPQNGDEVLVMDIENGGEANPIVFNAGTGDTIGDEQPGITGSNTFSIDKDLYGAEIRFIYSAVNSDWYVVANEISDLTSLPIIYSTATVAGMTVTGRLYELTAQDGTNTPGLYYVDDTGTPVNTIKEAKDYVDFKLATKFTYTPNDLDPLADILGLPNNNVAVAGFGVDWKITDAPDATIALSEVEVSVGYPKSVYLVQRGDSARLRNNITQYSGEANTYSTRITLTAQEDGTLGAYSDQFRIGFAGVPTDLASSTYLDKQAPVGSTPQINTGIWTLQEEPVEEVEALRGKPVDTVAELTALTAKDDELRLVKADNIRRVFKLGTNPIIATDIADDANTGTWSVTEEIETPTSVLAIKSVDSPNSPVDLNNTTLVTGHNINELDYIDFSFKDNVGGVNRPWNISKIDAKQLIREGSAYIWNYDQAYIRINVVDATTGQFTFLESTRQAFYVGSIGYKREQVGASGGLANVPETARYQNNKFYNEGDFVIENNPFTGLATTWYADADFTSVDEDFEGNGFTISSSGVPEGTTTDITGQNIDQKTFSGTGIFAAIDTIRDNDLMIRLFRSPLVTGNNTGFYGATNSKMRYALSTVDGSMYEATVPLVTVNTDPSVNTNEWKPVPNKGDFDYVQPGNGQPLTENRINIVDVGNTYTLPPVRQGAWLRVFVRSGTVGVATINKTDNSAHSSLSSVSGQTIYYSNGIDWLRIEQDAPAEGGATLRNYFEITTLGDQNTGFTQGTGFGWDGIDACIIAGGGMTSRIPIPDDTATRTIEWVVKKTQTPQNFIVEGRDNPNSNGVFVFLNTLTGTITREIKGNANIAPTITEEVIDLGDYWRFTCVVTGKTGNIGNADFIFTFVAGDGYSALAGGFVPTTEDICMGSVKYEKAGDPIKQWVLGENTTNEKDDDGRDWFIEFLSDTTANKPIGTGGLLKTSGAPLFCTNFEKAWGVITLTNGQQIQVGDSTGGNVFRIYRANGVHIACDITGYVVERYDIKIKYTKQ